MTDPSPTPHSPTAEPAADRGRWWIIPAAVYLSITGGGAAADLISKERIFEWRGLPGQQPIYWLWENYAGIQTAVNPGALFGMGAGWGLVFAIASIAALVGIVCWLFIAAAARQMVVTVCTALISGGIIGNLYDRLGLWYEPHLPPEWSRGVRDWILLCYGRYTWPNFNIADSLLVVGTAVLFVWSLRQPAESTASDGSV